MQLGYPSRRIDIAGMELQDEIRKELHNEGLKEKLLSDPTYSDQILSHLSRSAITDKVAAKLPQNANFEKAMLAIDKDDPRRAMLAKLQTDMPNIIKASPYGENPVESIMKAVQQRSDASKEDTYKFIRSKSGFFDKEVAPLAGYEEWERKNPGMTSPISSFMMGAGGQLASEGLTSRAAMALPFVGKAAGTIGRLLSFAPPIPGLGMGAKLLGAGLMTIPAMMATDVVKKGAANAGYEMSANPIKRMLEEVAFGAPGFIGVNKLAGMGIAKGASSIAKMGKDLNVLGDAPTTPYNTFDRLASPGMQSMMKDGALTSSPIAGKLVPKSAVTGEDIRAFGKELQNKEAKALFDVKKEASFRKLEPEDDERILRGADPDEVMNSRVVLNKEKDIAETAAAKAKLAEDISLRASLLRMADNSLDHPSSLERARRTLSPTQEETSADFKFLREKYSNNPEVVDVMSPQEAAEKVAAWREHGVPALRDPIEKMLPQAVPPKLIKPTAPLNIKTGVPTVIHQGMGPQLRLSETGEGALSRTLQETEAKRAAAQLKLDEASAVSPALNQIITELGGNQEILKDTRIKNFLGEQARIIMKGKATAEEISNTAANTTERYAKLNALATQMHDDLNSHIINSGYADTQRAQAAQTGLSKLTREFKLGNTEALEKKAVSDTNALVGKLMPESSPKHAEIMAMARQDLKEAIAEAGSISKEEFAKHPGIIDIFKKYQNVLWTGAGAAALVPISALFGGNEAQAAPFSGRSLTPATVDAIKSSGNAIDKMVAKFFEAGHGSPVLTDDGQGIKQMMRGYSFAPSDASVFSKTSTNRFDSILSPHTRGEIHFDARDVNGVRLPHNAAVELGDRSQVIAANVEASLSAVKNILKGNGIEENLSAIADETLPLVTKYHNAVNLELPYYNARLKMLDDVMEGKYRSEANTKATQLSKQIKAAGKDISKLDPEDREFFRMLSEEKDGYSKKIAELQPTIDNFKSDHDALMRGLAAKYPTSRVALAVDGTGMSDADPWLRNMLSPAERNAVDKIRAINDVYAVRMQETGHDIISGAYMHHPSHPSVNYAASLEHLDKLSGDGAEAMRLVNFFHRGENSKLMIPDTAYIMGKYVPDAAKRIEISDFWKMGKEGGWDAVRRQMNARGGYDGAVKLLDDLRTAFDPMDTGPAGKWLNKYAAFEVARLLTLSPSVSFKHMLKTMGNWAIFPAKESALASGYNLGLVSRQIAQDMAGGTFKGKDLVADLGKAYTNQAHIYAAVSDMAPYELPVNTFDKFITKWNQLGSAAVNGVERWDRGQTFASAMLMASKRGMTPEQARYALMDSVLKVNFLTGPNNPKWLKDPFIRTMMMFQGTPFKILEQRAMLSVQAGKDIKNTGLEILRQLRADVKTGEERFKWNLIKDEFTKSKDIYGTAYTSQFLKQMMVMGTVIYTGKQAFDSNLWGHVIHIPGTQLGERGINLGVNPIVGAAYKTGSGGNITPGNEDEFWMSRFFSSWLGNTGFPAIAHKMARLKEDDIPAMYRDSKLSYLFGVPKVKEK